MTRKNKQSSKHSSALAPPIGVSGGRQEASIESDRAPTAAAVRSRETAEHRTTVVAGEASHREVAVVTQGRVVAKVDEVEQPTAQPATQQASACPLPVMAAVAPQREQLSESPTRPAAIDSTSVGPSLAQRAVQETSEPAARPSASAEALYSLLGESKVPRCQIDRALLTSQGDADAALFQIMSKLPRVANLLQPQLPQQVSAQSNLLCLRRHFRAVPQADIERELEESAQDVRFVASRLSDRITRQASSQNFREVSSLFESTESGEVSPDVFRPFHWRMNEAGGKDSDEVKLALLVSWCKFIEQRSESKQNAARVLSATKDIIAELSGLVAEVLAGGETIQTGIVERAAEIENAVYRACDLSQLGLPQPVFDRLIDEWFYRNSTAQRRHANANMDWQRQMTQTSPLTAKSKTELKSWAKSFSVKLCNVMDDLDKSLIEKSEAIRVCFLSILSRQHCLLFGPPGTAKSLLVESICDKITPTEKPPTNWFFSLVLHAGTSLEDIIGPVDLEALKENRFVRTRTGKLCGETTFFAFLDECFKAQRQVLSVLLSVMNERVFYDGSVRHRVPLHTLFGASNEIMIDPSMGALLDRFLFRVLVNPVRSSVRPALWEGQRTSSNDNIKLEFSLICDFVQVVEAILASGQHMKGGWMSTRAMKGATLRILDAIDSGLASLEPAAEETTSAETVKGGGLLSDRRRVHLGKALIAVAVASGRTEVHPWDLLMIIYGAWKTEKQYEKTLQTVSDILRQAFDNEVPKDCQAQEAISVLKSHAFLTNELKELLMKPWSKEDADRVDGASREEKLRKLLEKNQQEEERQLLIEQERDAEAQAKMLEARKDIQAAKEKKQATLLSLRTETEMHEMMAGLDEEALILKDKLNKKLSESALRAQQEQIANENLVANRLAWETQSRDAAKALQDTAAQVEEVAARSNALMDEIWKSVNQQSIDRVTELVRLGADVNRIRPVNYQRDGKKMEAKNYESVLSVCATLGKVEFMKVCLAGPATAPPPNLASLDQLGDCVVHQVVKYRTKTEIKSMLRVIGSAMQTNDRIQWDSTQVCNGKNIMDLVLEHADFVELLSEMTALPDVAGKGLLCKKLASGSTVWQALTMKMGGEEPAFLLTDKSRLQ